MPTGERADERWQPCWAQRSDRPGEVGSLSLPSHGRRYITSHLTGTVVRVLDDGLVDALTPYDTASHFYYKKQLLLYLWFSNTHGEALFLPSICLAHISEWNRRSAHTGNLSRILAFYYSWSMPSVWILLGGVSSISSFITAALGTIRLPSAAAEAAAVWHVCVFVDGYINMCVRVCVCLPFLFWHQ